MPYLYLAGAILGEVIATSALKASEGFTKLLPSLLVVAGYALAFYLLSMVLKTIPVGVAYAIWSGAGIALITVVGWVVYGQKIDVAGVVGLALIMAGVIVLQLFSKAAAH
jgi:small multidrug resistance pump